jgi:hypothetical protein
MLYISGPISGKWMGNVLLFNVVHALLSVCGYSVVDPTWLEAGSALTQDEYMWVWGNTIPVCTCMVMLPGWHASRGATAEHGMAVEHGIRIIDLEWRR